MIHLMGKVSQNEEPYMEGAILHSGRHLREGNGPSMVHYKKIYKFFMVSWNPIQILRVEMNQKNKLWKKLHWTQ
jgi:hypothetical protein